MTTTHAAQFTNATDAREAILAGNATITLVSQKTNARYTYRIRKAKGEKIPYVLVVGDDDVAARTVGVNPRGGEVDRGVPLDTFAQRLVDEVDDQVHAAR